MPSTLTENIQAYINARKDNKLEAIEKEYEKARKAAVNVEQADKVETEFASKRQKLITDYTVDSWLDNAAKRAGQISMATHAIKFTHSAAKGSNFLDQQLGTNSHYLDTQSLNDIAIDAVGNAAALDVASLLQLKDSKSSESKDKNSKSLLDYLREENHSPLAPLAKNTEQLHNWVSGLTQALVDNDPSSHILAKQVYFPIDDKQYHLLAPLSSSALCQAIYEKINFARYSQDMKAIRDAKKANLPCNEKLISYPDLAVTFAGGSKPQNISKLNSGRSGRTYLFDARPPHWENKNKPPKDCENIFNQLEYVSRFTVLNMANFLLKVINKESNLKIRNYLSKLVNQVGEDCINASVKWRNLPAGWSDDLDKLPIHQAKWLDPNNPRWQQDNLDWQTELSQNFGLWLKDSVEKASKNQLTLSVGEADEWRQSFHQLLREVY